MPLRDTVENRSAFFLMGILLIVVGTFVTPLLCGVGFLLIIIGAIMYVRED